MILGRGERLLDWQIASHVDYLLQYTVSVQMLTEQQLRTE